MRPVHYEWLGVRIGGPDASMKGQWWVLFLAAAVVFVGFFAIGRLSTGASSHGEPSSALRAPTGGAAIPGALRGDSPIAGSVPSAIAPKPVRSAAPAASAAGAASAVTQPLAEDASRTPAPSSVVAPPVVQPAPVKAAAPVAANPQHGGSSGGPSVGGSFDSSE